MASFEVTTEAESIPVLKAPTALMHCSLHVPI